jgi:hypothetical protein
VDVIRYALIKSRTILLSTGFNPISCKLRQFVFSLAYVSRGKERDMLPVIYTAKIKCRKLETNIPRKGISGPQSVNELYIPTMGLHACSAGGNM